VPRQNPSNIPSRLAIQLVIAGHLRQQVPVPVVEYVSKSAEKVLYWMDKGKLPVPTPFCGRLELKELHRLLFQHLMGTIGRVPNLRNFLPKKISKTRK
jgi:hypothetical protein